MERDVEVMFAAPLGAEVFAKIGCSVVFGKTE